MSKTRKTLIGAGVVAALALTLPATMAFAKGGHDGHRGPRGGDIAFEELDLNGDGQLTMEEMKNHRKARFAKADSNGDGELSAAELEAAATARHKKRVARMISKLDTDGNGTLSEAEMEAGKEGRHGGKRAEKREARAERMFERADENGDGVLSKAEFDAAKAKRMERRGPKADN